MKFHKIAHAGDEKDDSKPHFEEKEDPKPHSHPIIEGYLTMNHKCVDISLLRERPKNVWEKRALEDPIVVMAKEDPHLMDRYRELRAHSLNFTPKLIDGQEALSYEYGGRPMNVFFVKGKNENCNFLYVLHVGYKPPQVGGYNILYEDGKLIQTSFACDTVLIDTDNCWFSQKAVGEEFLVGNSKLAWETFERNKPELVREKKVILFGPSLGSLLTVHFAKWFAEAKGTEKIHQVAVAGVWKNLRDIFRWRNDDLSREVVGYTPHDLLELVPPMRFLIEENVDVRVHLIDFDANFFEDQLDLARQFSSTLDKEKSFLLRLFLPDKTIERMVLDVFRGDRNLRVYLHHHPCDENEQHSSVSVFLTNLSKVKHAEEQGTFNHEKDLYKVLNSLEDLVFSVDEVV